MVWGLGFRVWGLGFRVWGRRVPGYMGERLGATKLPDSTNNCRKMSCSLNCLKGVIYGII